ncbi:MAG: thioesterase family protein [Defluviicoccus sp.]|nr:MAG: thioesterase family protein [Defluviicoccus sp.]
MSERLQPYHETVRPEWVDYNGHMNVAYYVLVFDHATDATLDALGLGETYRIVHGCSVFVGDMHVTYRQEVGAGDALIVTTRLLARDAKRLILFHEMRSNGGDGVVASNEVLCVHVDLATRRSAPWPQEGAASLDRALAADGRDSPPLLAGRSVRLPA